MFRGNIIYKPYYVIHYDKGNENPYCLIIYINYLLNRQISVYICAKVSYQAICVDCICEQVCKQQWDRAGLEEVARRRRGGAAARRRGGGSVPLRGARAAAAVPRRGRASLSSCAKVVTCVTR